MCIDLPDMEVDLHVSSVAKLSIVIDNNDISFKSDIFLNYDADSANSLPTLEEVDDSSTDDFFLLGTPTLSPTMNVLNWSLKNPGTITTGQRLLCPVVNAQLPSALQIQLGQSRAGDSCEHCLIPARLCP